MYNKIKYFRLFAVVLMVGVFALLFTASGVSAANIAVNVNDGGCVTGTGQADPYTVVYCEIQDAIVDATSGDVIMIAAGTYAEQLSITKDNLTLMGADENTVIIDGTATSGNHILVAADDVTLKNFTLNGHNAPPGNYGIKVEGANVTTKNTNFTVMNVTVNASYRTGLDINGVDGVDVDDITVMNVPWGNGVSLTDVENADLNGITTQNNAWGGVAVYTYGRFFPLGSSNVTIDNLTGNEVTLFYVERGNYNNPSNPEPVMNLITPQFTHTVGNHTYRGANSPNFTHYLPNEADALAFALALPNPEDSFIQVIAGGNFLVVPGLIIQTAVDAAVDGDTVTISEDTFVEQVVIDAKNITLEGTSFSSVIQAPVLMDDCFTTSTDNHPVVCVTNTDNATVQNMTIDGAGHGNGNNRFEGVAYHNAGGTVQGTVIQGVRDTPFSGNQHGVALYLFNNDLVSRNFNVYNNQILDFQKNAMAINADATTPLVVDVAGNVVTGAGPTTVTAQNGIQVSGDLISGSINGNEVSGIAYDNTSSSIKYVATSLLNYYAEVDITNNTVYGGHVGIYNIDGAGSLSFNQITIEKIGVYAYGIIATDPPQAVPTPFDEPAPPAVQNLMLAELNVVADGNFILFKGSDNTATYGFEADSGYGVDDLAVTAVNNTVIGFEYGIVFYECESGCSSGVFTTLVATDNCLYDNNFGMYASTTPIVNGTNNWWGAEDGPSGDGPGSGDAVSGSINFMPFETAACTVDNGHWYNDRTGELYDKNNLQIALDDALMGDEITALGDNPLEGGAVASTAGVTINLNERTAGPGSPFLEVSAADVSVVGPGVLDGLGSADPAVRILSGGNNFTLENMEVTGWADGVEVAASPASFKLVGNFIHDNTDAGLQVNGGVTMGGIVTIEGNLFKDNGGNGVQHNGTGAVGATYNSWGDVDGPAGPAGDGTGGSVTFTPWTFSEIYFDMNPPNEATSIAVIDGQNFNVELKAEAENLYGLTFAFAYSDTLLAYNGITFAAPWAGRCADDGTVAGLVRYHCNLLFPTAEWDGGAIGTVNFDSIGVGTSALDIDHIETTSAAIGGVKVFVNNAGFNAPSDPDRDITDEDDGTVGVTATFTGFIDLQGRNNDSGATMQVFDDANGSTLMSQGTSGAGGSYTTTPVGDNLLIIASTYWFYADRALYLPTTANFPTSPSTHSDTLTTSPTLLSLLVLFGGDATNDNFINIQDASCIGGDYSTAGGVCFLAGSNSDVNGDGIVNIQDLSLMGGNWMRTFSGPWTP